MERELQLKLLTVSIRTPDCTNYAANISKLTSGVKDGVEALIELLSGYRLRSIAIRARPVERFHGDIVPRVLEFEILLLLPLDLRATSRPSSGLRLRPCAQRDKHFRIEKEEVFDSFALEVDPETPVRAPPKRSRGFPTY